MRSIAIIQARTNSSRLPAKVMLPVKRIPLVVLAAKRAANKGRDVLVATSQEPSDDGLVELMSYWKIKYFRGSLNNTLERFVKALESYPDNSLVFRLTADNVLPDGILLDELEEDFTKRQLEYLCCNGAPSGLPYGVSAELTRLSHLRDAYHNSQQAEDKEHVTPYIIRKFGKTYFEKYKKLDSGNLNCSIDYLEDFLAVQKLFSDINNPIDISFLDLIKHLAQSQNSQYIHPYAHRLVIGGAQLGCNYGIANRTGQPAREEIAQILNTANRHGIRYIDTARAYGHSENMIGQYLEKSPKTRFKIITKLSPFNNDDLKDLPNSGVKAFVESGVYESCLNLRCNYLETLLLHRVDHLDVCGGLLWRQLLHLKRQGRIQQLGASIQSPEELLRVLKEPEIRFIQLPFNILDWRWEKVTSVLLNAKSERNLVVHVRSVFLQGLLLSDEHELWKRANIGDSSIFINWLQECCALYKRENVVDLCIAYVNTQDWVDGVVLGMETNSQLIENIKYFSNSLLSSTEIQELKKNRPFLPESSLNPAEWSR